MASDRNQIEAGVRAGLREVQQSGVLCVHPDLAQRQLEGAVQIVMEHIERHCPRLIKTNRPKAEPAAGQTDRAGR